MLYQNIFKIINRGKGEAKMKKSVAIILLLICFLFGVAFGANSKTQSTSQASASSTLTKQIEQYEQSLKDEDDEVYIPYSQVYQQSSVSDESPFVSAGDHNSVSQFGQDAGNMFKTIVREVLRAIVKLCDQWITS